MGTNGVLFIDTITDSTLVGTHHVQFEAYLKDLDPSAIYSKPVALTLTISIEDP